MNLEKWKSHLGKKKVLIDSALSGLRVSSCWQAQLTRPKSQLEARDLLVKVLRETKQECERMIHLLLY
jgi:hypothetical protein